ncbi:hypothetical protein [Oceaniferula marina]|nr:hypothetical protein [Oceaniferula marina]
MRRYHQLTTGTGRVNFSYRRGNNPPPNQSRGFALVATISVMVLLVMIALAMLSLSTVELRSSTAAKAQEEARANARVALMMAIGELQKYAGPDQRVTAEADILSSAGFYKNNRSEGRKHYLGIYSTEEWHERDSNGLRKAWKTYDETRNRDAFMRWLVSGDSEDRNSLGFATETVAEDQSIELVGSGTVGENSASDRIRVPYDAVTDAQGKVSGRMAWWVGDQGVKARLDLADLRRDTSQKEWTNRRERVNPVQMGMASVEGFENIGIDPENEEQQEELQRILSYSQSGFFNGGALALDTLKERYHDVTTLSRGVLADVALGGLKRDLSLPFELPNLTADSGSSDWIYNLNGSDVPQERESGFAKIQEFNNSGDQRSQWVSQEYDGTERWPNGFRPDWWGKKVGYVYSYPGNSGSDVQGNKQYLRGANWDMLRNHYRMYKREYEQLGSSDPTRQGVRNPSDDRTWLVRSYDPPSPHTGSKGQTPLTLTAVGEFGPGAANASPSKSLLDPYYTYGFAASRGIRHWNDREVSSLGLVPIMTRLTLVIGTYGEDTDDNGDIDRMQFTVDAVGTLWNPYNVPIEVESVFSDIKLEGLAMNAKLEGEGWEIDLPFNSLRLGVTEEKDPNYPFASSPPSQLIRLEPGELRTYSLNYPEPKDYFAGSGGKVPGSFVNNNWTGGLFGRYSRRTVPAGKQVEFECTPNTNTVWLQNYIGYFHTAKGQFMNPFMRGDFHDLPQFSGMVVKDASSIGTPIKKKITVPEGADKKMALMTIDFKLRSSGETLSGNSIAREFDPRAIVNHVKAAGQSGKGDVPANWDVSIESISDYDQVQIGIGSGGRNNGFWGPSHEGDGETHVIYYEIPDAPIASIGGLQHAQTSPAAWDQPYAIGGSSAPQKLNRNQIFRTQTESAGFENVYYDDAYLLNSALWDRYYFTGLTFSDTNVDESNALPLAEEIMAEFLDPQKENPLGNRRLSLSGGQSSPPIEELTHYRWIARHLMLDGAFNVNSTRVEAWKAWLSSLKGADVDRVNPVNGRLTKDSNSNTPFSRSVVAGGKEGEDWRGYNTLSDSQIQKLAENIVEEVKKRGPFLSVADFVNRRISSDETGKEGALQAALRASSLNLGSGVEEGIPGTIRQGDVLAGLGASIAARSDTFIVRAYGDSLTATGEVRARAWCEAVLQRIPTPVDDNGKLLDMPNPEFPGNNPGGTDAYVENAEAPLAAKDFGRQFRVISFRWLAKDEV